MKKQQRFYQSYEIIVSRRTDKRNPGYFYQIWSRRPSVWDTFNGHKRKLIYGASVPHNTFDEALEAAKTIIDKRIETQELLKPIPESEEVSQ